MTQTLDITTMIRDIIEIIEIQLSINIVEDTISYERLVTHLRFAIQHIKAGESIYELDAEMIDIIKEKFKDAFLCALSIGTFVKKEYGFEFPEKNYATSPCIFSGSTNGQSHAETKNAFDHLKSVFISVLLVDRRIPNRIPLRIGHVMEILIAIRMFCIGVPRLFSAAEVHDCRVFSRFIILLPP